MAHYFTADTHFGDDAIRRFFGRPFGSAEQMDQAMIDRFSDLKPEDDLWIVGDFADCRDETRRENACRVFETLPGRKHLVRGNHDPDWVLRELGWTSVHDLVELEISGRLFVLCHYPMLVWNRVQDGAVHLFGHVHANWAGAGGQVNVGVDLWDFRPVSSTEAEILALQREPTRLHQRLTGQAF